jgi:hypothetical protein
MSTALTLFFILAALIFLIGTVITIAGIVRAPLGYEDKAGFHLVAAEEKRPNPVLSVWVDTPIRVRRSGSRSDEITAAGTQNPFDAFAG